MAVGAFTFYKNAHLNISGTINLGSTNFRAHFYTSASNFGTNTLSSLTSLTNEVASAYGYVKSGKAIGSVTWAAGTSAGQAKFTAAAWVLTAGASAIVGIKGVVIVGTTSTSAKNGANKLLCFSTLSTSQFTLSKGNTLTITPSASGIFVLAG